MNKEKKRKRVKALMFFAAFVLFSLFVAYFAGGPILHFVDDPESFRAWVDERGVLADLVFVLMVIFQVVIAIVPGEPFEIAAGYAFGYIEGTFVFLLGSIIGSAIVFLFVRKYGQQFCDVFFDRKKIENLKFLKNTKRNKALFFIIFAIPGTPKDLLSYFAGLSDMSFSWWMLIASVGRIPSLITSIIGGGAIGDGNYKTAIWVFAIACVLSVLGYFVYGAIIKKQGEK